MFYKTLSFLMLIISLEGGAANFSEAKILINELISSTKLDVGVSILHLESSNSVFINEHKRISMASVYKFPIALVIFKKIEQGQLKIDQDVLIKKTDIRGGFKGPIAKKYPEGGASLSVLKLIEYMVANSDNSATDLLLKLVGGPKEVTRTLRLWGAKNISIDRYEKSLIVDSNPGKEQLDTSSAKELMKLLVKFHRGHFLSLKNAKLLKSFMTNPKTPGHIARGLPKDTIQLHKSGWCSKTRCINDIGIITLPNSKGSLVISVLVTGDIKDSSSVSKMIGKIARISFEAAIK